jgi:hypothetical protein
VLTFGPKDNFAQAFLPLFYFDICVFTPILPHFRIRQLYCILTKFNRFGQIYLAQLAVISNLIPV